MDKDREKAEKKELCHYTDIVAFYGITHKKELWLGNLFDMNDTMEIKLFLQELKEETYRSCEEEERKWLDEFWRNVENKIDSQAFFGMSLSTRKDDAAQWERYGDKGAGVCLVFDKGNLEKLARANHFALNKVFYQREIKKHELYEGLQKLTKVSINNESVDSYISNLLETACFHKHWSFEAESEVRLRPVGDESMHPNPTIEMIGGRKKQVMKISIKSMLDETEDIGFEDLISEIIIGPRSSQDKRTLKHFIRECGYDRLAECIVESECPLR